MNCCRHLGKPSTAATSHSWRRSSCTVMANAGTTSEVLCQVSIIFCSYSLY